MRRFLTLHPIKLTKKRNLEEKTKRKGSATQDEYNNR
jgi:hypothetical protein